MKLRVLAVVAAITLVLNGGLAVQPSAAADPPRLRDLIINQSPVLSPAFESAVTAYNAQVYRSVTEVDIKPMVDDASVSVAVNGVAPAANGWVKVPVEVGVNSIPVTATKGGQSTTYTVAVTKVDTDYRGRKPIAGMTVTSNKDSAAAGPVTNVLDGNATTYWQPAAKPVTTDDADSDDTTKVLLDLGGSHNVSRIQLDTSFSPAGAWQPNIWNNNIDVSVSADEGATWSSVVDRANLREDQGDNSVRWEFGKVAEDVTHVRLAYVKYDQALDWIRWHRLEVFAGDQGALPEYPAPAEAATAPAPSNPDIHRSQELILRNGLHLSTWIPSTGYGRGVPTPEEWEAFGSPAPLFYDPDLFNIDFMKQNPTAEWALAKAPWGGNDMAHAGEPRNFITAEMEPYLGNALSFAYGDEGQYSTAENERFKKWFDYSKEQWPHVLVHSNQAHGRGWDSPAKMREYTDAADPDILSFDRYPWGWGANDPNGFWAGSAGRQPIYDMLGSPLSRAQRQIALEGVDGDRETPIVFGQYFDNFDYDVSESQKAMTFNASLAFGQKWLDLFRTEFQFDGSFMFDEDGAPTRALYEFARIINETRNLSDYLTPMTNDWVAFEPGKRMVNNAAVDNQIITGWRMGAVADAANSVAHYGVLDVEASNVGTINDGLPGDVMLGYFKALPGLEDADLDPVFGQDVRHAIMVVNALNGTTPKNGSERRNFLRNDNGQRWESAQDITITLDPSITAVKVVDPATGEAVNLPIKTDGGARSVTLANVGGGESRLLLPAGVGEEPTSDLLEAEDVANVFVGNARVETLYNQASNGATVGYIGGGNGKVGIRVDDAPDAEGTVKLQYFYPTGDRALLYACTNTDTPPTEGTELPVVNLNHADLPSTPAQSLEFTCEFSEGTNWVWFWSAKGAPGVDFIEVGFPDDVEPTPTATPTTIPTVTVTATATATTTATATATASATETVTATATATVTTTATATTTTSATETVTTTPTTIVTPTVTKTVTASPTSSPSATKPPVMDLYSTPGFHDVNGRRWYTSCEPYSQTVRCRTEIWSTQVEYTAGKFVSTTGWHFNNLTYLPQMTRGAWGDNPLANPGTFTSGNRQWRTECDTPETGGNGCRSFIWTPGAIEAQKSSTGDTHYVRVDKWVFNNIVRFR
ncbi:MAG: cadherin-like beta sandwich domain-containing protein [Propionibacteriaceae bacterium]|nr:cadherin-like beta sandwich domain-containing protein [Propionibacteriaceae bacterium]